MEKIIDRDEVGLGIESKAKRLTATATAIALRTQKYWESSVSLSTAKGVSRRKRMAMRQTAKGTTARRARKEEGSLEKRAKQRSVKMAVLRAT